MEDASDEYGYDQSNALVLPSKKRDTKIKKEEQKQVTRILSKKQRKNLEKIVEKKKKKEGVSFDYKYFRHFDCHILFRKLKLDLP